MNGALGLVLVITPVYAQHNELQLSSCHGETIRKVDGSRSLSPWVQHLFGPESSGLIAAFSIVNEELLQTRNGIP